MLFPCPLNGELTLRKFGDSKLLITTIGGEMPEDRSEPICAAQKGSIVASLCLCLAAGIFIPSAYSRITKKMEAVRDCHVGRLTVYDDGREWEELLSDNPRCLYDHALALRAAGRYNDSNAALRIGAEVSCDDKIRLMMGDNYRDLGAVGLAEESYRTAHLMVPRKLYPLHRLLLLYEAGGRMEEAKEIAEQIVSAKPRIKSSATEEMQEYARKFLADRDSIAEKDAVLPSDNQARGTQSDEN